MSTPLNKSLHLSSSVLINKEAAKIMEKQGIVTILWSDCERTKAASFQRTLSADMSSKKWLAQNAFSLAMKKIVSSKKILVSLVDSSNPLDEEDNHEEKKDQLEGKKQKEELEKPVQFDIWSSIVSQKDNQDTQKALPPPYTHPLVKRAMSYLTVKSLKICTESLGSETGSDGFSLDPPLETKDMVDEKEEEEEEEQQQEQDLKVFTQANDHRGEEFRVAKFHYASTGQKSKPKSFPPPLPSLSRQDGASLLMQTRRDNGRLVLEAVFVPSQNQFHAKRQDGRLVLTFLNHSSNEDSKDEKLVEVDQQQEEEEEEKNKIEAFEDKFEEFEEVYDNDEGGGHEENELEGEETGSFDNKNVPKGMEIMIEKEPKYECYWRAKPIANPITQQLQSTTLQNNGNNSIISKIPMPNEQKHLFVLRGNKGDYSGPLVKGCMEPRRFLLLLDPNCIATS